VTTPTVTSSPEVATEVVASVVAAAAAAARVLPSSAPLVAGEPVAGAAGIASLALPAGAVAVSARLSGSVRGEIVTVVGSELVDALKSSPLGALETAPAVAPALQAAASSFGDAGTESLQELPPAVAFDALSSAGAVVAVPLLVGGQVHAIFAAVVVNGANAADVASAVKRRAGLDMLRDVEMEVTAELGRTRMTVRELLSLSPGAVVELDRLAGSPSDLLVNGTLIARGEVVVVDEEFGIRITEIVVPGDEGERRA
jgi:flagellar motor switch protein FliN/FliY